MFITAVANSFNGFITTDTQKALRPFNETERIFKPVIKILCYNSFDHKDIPIKRRLTLESTFDRGAA